MRPPDAGFTLIEALVALTVLAVTAVSLLAAVEAHVARIDALEFRVLAQIAAENRLVEREVDLQPASDRVALLGRTLMVAEARTSTPDPDLERIDFTVSEPASGRTFRGFFGFIPTQQGSR